MSEETHELTKQEATRKGRPGKEQKAKGTPENRFATWLKIGFYGDRISFGVVSGQLLCLTVLPGSARILSQDGGQREGFWELVGRGASPFDLSHTLPVGGGLLVPCSLPGLPVVKHLTQTVTVVPGQGGRFQSACFP